MSERLVEKRSSASEDLYNLLNKTAVNLLDFAFKLAAGCYYFQRIIERRFSKKISNEKTNLTNMLNHEKKIRRDQEQKLGLNLLSYNQIERL